MLIAAPLCALALAGCGNRVSSDRVAYLAADPMSDFTLDFAISSPAGLGSQGETGNFGGSRTPASLTRTFVVPLSREIEAIEIIRDDAEANGWAMEDGVVKNSYNGSKIGIDEIRIGMRVWSRGPVEPTPEQERTDDTPVTIALSLSTLGN